MYITAQRVRPLKLADTQGINAFLHQHGNDEMVDWKAPDVRRIAEARTGRLVAKSIEVKPGMNRVLSYVDVAAADDTLAAGIVAALDAFEQHVSANLPVVQIIDRIGIRFDAQPGLPDQELLEEYRSLKEHVVRLLLKSS